MVPYMLTVAFFRLLNGASHLWFKKVAMKRIAVEMAERRPDPMPPAQRDDGISALA
jgi:hypothetical protein